MCGYAYLQSDLYPGVAEQADALVLETSIERCVSSSLTFRTNCESRSSGGQLFL